MHDSIFRRGGRKLVSVAASMAVAAALVPGFTASASAASYATDTDKYVTCASFRAAEPTPEILGLNNVASNNAWGALGALSWSSPYYYFFGTSEYNSNPNPLMVNTVQNAKEDESGKYTPCMVTDSSRKGGADCLAG